MRFHRRVGTTAKPPEADVIHPPERYGLSVAMPDSGALTDAAFGAGSHNAEARSISSGRRRSQTDAERHVLLGRRQGLR